MFPGCLLQLRQELHIHLATRGNIYSILRWKLNAVAVIVVGLATRGIHRPLSIWRGATLRSSLPSQSAIDGAVLHPTYTCCLHELQDRGPSATGIYWWRVQRRIRACSL